MLPCKKYLPKTQYSTNQWSKSDDVSRCIDCLALGKNIEKGTDILNIFSELNTLEGGDNDGRSDSFPDWSWDRVRTWVSKNVCWFYY